MTYNRGDKIRLNRQLAETETVMCQTENVVETYEGHTYHVTKVVALDPSVRDVCWESAYGKDERLSFAIRCF
jgi:hypothetical protein